MPVYTYLCPNNHVTSRCESMKDHVATKIPCDICMESATQEYHIPGTKGGQMSDATRKLLEVPFGKRKAKEMIYSKDVSAHIEKIEKKYGVFGKGISSSGKDE